MVLGLRVVAGEQAPGREVGGDDRGHGLGRVHEPHPVVLPVADLRAVPAERRQEESERVVFEATQTPFDLTSIPLIRWRLLRLEDEIWELVQVEHHFVHDGWSFSVLLRAIKAL